MTLRDALHEAAATISHPDARRDAEILLAHLLERDRAWLLAHSEDELKPATLEALRELTARRAAHEPLQHLTGTQEFFGLSFRVTPDTLIPRPETEHLIEAVLEWFAEKSFSRTIQLLDIGAGSGAIAIALAEHLSAARITAVDISTAALEVARQNAARLGQAHNIHFLHSDLLDALAPELAAGLRFDAIVSNPPYIPFPDAATLQPEVFDYEPHTALFGGEDGLDLYRRIIPAAAEALRPGGLLALEIGFGQQEDIAALLAGWRNIRFLNDYANIPRVALAEKP